ncbi:MAG: VanZ family protein [Rubrivivax sp.]|nr:VanZ family protein [Rubrivivax sp.]
MTPPGAAGPAGGAPAPEASLQRLAMALTLLSLAIIVHGSLYPWRWQPPPAWGPALQWLLVPTGWESLASGRGDLIGNVLLFIPLSALGAWWQRARPWPWRWLVFGLGGAVLGLLLQVAQLAIPGRSPALSDAWWNTVGLVLGFGLTGLVPACLRWLRARLHSAHLGAYAAAGFWLAMAWWPLLPGISGWWMAVTWRQLWNFNRLSLPDAWWQAAGVFILAQALRALPGRAAVLLLVVLAGWLGKLVFSYTLPASMVANTVGWSLGLVAGMMAWALRERQAMVLLVGVCLAAMASDALRGLGLGGEAKPAQWWPFVAVLGHQRVAYSLGLLVWAWWITALAAAALRLGARPWPLWLGLTFALALLEWAHRHWPGQQADVTLVLLPTLCAWLLHVAARRGWWQPRLNPPPAAPGTIPLAGAAPGRGET